MLRSPLFRRLFLPYLLLILAGTLAVGFWGAAQIRATYVERTEHALLPEAILLRRLLGDVETAPDLQSQVQKLGGALNHRITILAEDGRVLADTWRDPSSLSNQLDRGEVRRAASGDYGLEIRSSDPREPTMYLAVRAGPDDAPRGFVRLAVSLRELDEDVRAMYVKLAAVASLAFAIAGLICYLVARRAVRPIVQLTTAAEALASGDFGRRLSPDDPGEIGDLAAALNHLADSLGILVSRSAKREEELRAVLASMVEAVVGVDDRSSVRVANDAAGRLFGFDPASARGRPLPQLVQNPGVLALAEEVQRTGQVAHARVGPSPGAPELDVVACPVRGPSSEGGLVIVAHDAAESHRYQQLRSEFVSNVSHELRTPLAIIRGFVETLQDGAAENPEKRARFLDRIARNVQQLTNLVDDLLQLSELEERRAEAHTDVVDVVALLEGVCESFRPAAEAKEQKLQFECAADTAQVMGQARHLERAFANLADNAIKYTDAGGWIRVVVRPERGRIVVEVEDTGIGIPEEDQPRIFERFYRVDKSRSREMGGTGLGLSIVKHVIQSHGGQVQVSSRPGQGSKFKVTLPAMLTSR